MYAKSLNASHGVLYSLRLSIAGDIGMASKKEIPAGTNFGMLTVIGRAEDYISPKGQHEKRYLCQCECGEKCIIRGSWLKRGKPDRCKQCSKTKATEKRIRDLTNKRFGRWTVEERADTMKGVYWICRCDCGTRKVIRGTSLTSGNSTSCGCYSSEKLRELRILNLTGKKYGNLTVLFQVKDFLSSVNGKKRSRWKCKCDCGNITYVNGTDLTSGNTRSCGCYKEQRTSETHFQDLSGQRFGMLLVLKRVEDHITTENGRTRPQFLCKCDCGNFKIIQKDSLMNGTSSCGCLNSQGERKIAECLREHNIKFEIQYGFPDLKNGLLKFDFAILDSSESLTALIEYQGEQHFQPIEFFGGKEKFDMQQYNDELKRVYCANKGIPLIEIPYWEDIEKYLKDFY